MAVKILLADGRRLFREGLRLLLERYPDLKIVGEANEGQAVVRLVEPLSVDVVILNTHRITTYSVIELVRAVVATRPAVRILILSHRPAPSFIQQVFAAGAAGCLHKDSASEELVSAIRAVLSRQNYLSPTLAQILSPAGAAPVAESARPVRLSPRERQVLRLIAQGQAPKEIARQLGVGAKTVETHRRRMMEKLGQYSLVELTRYANSQGLAPQELHI